MLKVSELLKMDCFTVKNLPEGGGDREIGSIYCCDLLSIAMSKMTEAAAWVTVMSNLNTLAVASLSEVACVVLAEGVAVEEAMLQKAVQQEITVLWTELPIFDAALKIQKAFEA